LRGYRLAAWSEPAEAAGGDTYDVVGLLQDPITGRFKLTDRQAERAIFLLADATGHGIGPALSVTQVRAMLRMALRRGDGIIPIVSNMNSQLADDLTEGRFITAWFGSLNVKRHELTSFSAGQAPFFHFNGADGTCKVYSADMPPFGLLDEMEATLPEPVRMNPGDLFVVLSDGLIEPQDADHNLYGKDRIVDLITRHLEDDPEDILKALIHDIETFTGGAPPDDDRTAIIIKREAQI
jgi:phosphoserine phosphatase